MDDLEQRRKRLIFRGQRRGTSEADALIGGCAIKFANTLTEEQLGRFEAILDRNDPDVMAWIAGQQPVPPEFDNDIMEMLIAFRQSRIDLG